MNNGNFGGELCSWPSGIHNFENGRCTRDGVSEEDFNALTARRDKATSGDKIEPTAEQLSEARDWIADCAWGDLEPEEVAELTPTQIMRGVSAHYEGGWAGFLRDSLAV